MDASNSRKKSKFKSVGLRSLKLVIIYLIIFLLKDIIEPQLLIASIQVEYFIGRLF